MGLKDTVTEREAAQLNNDGVVRDVDPNYASEKDIKSWWPASSFRQIYPPLLPRKAVLAVSVVLSFDL